MSLPTCRAKRGTIFASAAVIRGSTRRASQLTIGSSQRLPSLGANFAASLQDVSSSYSSIINAAPGCG
jgi:hypothetical protein